METFADRLRQEIGARPGVKQSDIAEAAGVSTQAVSGWLSGRYNISDEKAKKVAEFLGCSWVWLAHGELPDEANDRFHTLPGPVREWLDRQARLVTEFEEKHPLLAGMIFSGQSEDGDGEQTADMVRALDRLSATASVSGTLICNGGTISSGDRPASRALKRLAAETKFTRAPSTATKLKGKKISEVMPASCAEVIDKMLTEVSATGKEAARVIRAGEVFLVVTALPYSEGMVIVTLVDVSDHV